MRLRAQAQGLAGITAASLVLLRVHVHTSCAALPSAPAVVVLAASGSRSMGHALQRAADSVSAINTNASVPADHETRLHLAPVGPHAQGKGLQLVTAAASADSIAGALSAVGAASVADMVLWRGPCPPSLTTA